MSGAVEQAGPLVVERRLRLGGTAGPEAAVVAGELEGVVEARTGNGGLRIRYDRARCDFGALVTALRAAGCAAEPGWSGRWRTAWFRYLDRNLRDSAQGGGAACCSDPREIYASRRKR